MTSNPCYFYPNTLSLKDDTKFTPRSSWPGTPHNKTERKRGNVSVVYNENKVRVLIHKTKRIFLKRKCKDHKAKVRPEKEKTVF